MNALLKLTLIFAGIVVSLSRKWNLGVVLLLAAVATGILFAHPIQEIGRDALLASVDFLTLRVALVIAMIMVLGELLRRTAAM